MTMQTPCPWSQQLRCHCFSLVNDFAEAKKSLFFTPTNISILQHCVSIVALLRCYVVALLRCCVVGIRSFFKQRISRGPSEDGMEFSSIYVINVVPFQQNSSTSVGFPPIFPLSFRGEVESRGSKQASTFYF